MKDRYSGNKPYEWVKTQVLAQADNEAQHKLSFGDRMEFLNGVRWLLDLMDKNAALGVLCEIIDGDLPRGTETPQIGDKELTDKGLK